MEENSKSSNSKILIIALTVLLFALIGYTFYNNNDHKEAIKFLQDEKEQIIGNLTAMEEKYDVAIAENTSLSDSLTMEKEKIAILKDSVQNLKKINASCLKKSFHWRYIVDIPLQFIIAMALLLPQDVH